MKYWLELNDSIKMAEDLYSTFVKFDKVEADRYLNEIDKRIEILEEYTIARSKELGISEMEFLNRIEQSQKSN